MKLPKFGRKKKILDLTERYRKQQEKIAQMQSDNQKEDSQESPEGTLSFLGNLASNSGSETSSDEYANISENVEEKRKKLAKRLMDITDKLEDLSNQIYHLQQRVEVLEKKSNINRFE